MFDPFAFILALPEIVSLLGTLFAFITCIICWDWVNYEAASANQTQKPFVLFIKKATDVSCLFFACLVGIINVSRENKNMFGVYNVFI